MPGAKPGFRVLTIAAVLAGVLALSLGSWLHYRDTEYRPAPGVVAMLPDPDTSAMTAPVARVIRQARKAALARPDSATAVGRLGQVLHAHWLYDEAATCYRIASQIAPADFRWAYLLAGVEEIRGADGELIDRLFRAAIHLAPGYPPAYVRHADALLRLGRWAGARDAYTAAIELNPGLVLAHRGLGQAVTLLGDAPAAVRHLEHAASLSPEDRITQIALARAYTLAGNGDLAAEAASDETLKPRWIRPADLVRRMRPYIVYN